MKNLSLFKSKNAICIVSILYVAIMWLTKYAVQELNNGPLALLLFFVLTIFINLEKPLIVEIQEELESEQKPTFYDLIISLYGLVKFFGYVYLIILGIQIFN